MSSKKNSKLFEKLRKVPHITNKPYHPQQSKPPQKILSRVGKIGTPPSKNGTPPQKKSGYIRCSEQWKNGGRIPGKPGCTLK